ncbi:unnamed protein product [Heligmosomoides polygyrus]|uniref:SCP domain-containing protein n=1 Tax=Heligmosomoides polygyrus TaxID=6339 RepID=A0A183FVD8_HELPZ|nr:unnamed protein product [Heligmosomoides polygyrus]
MLSSHDSNMFFKHFQEYSCRLEKSAMDYANYCTFVHSYLPDIGENLYRFSIPNFDKLKLASMVRNKCSLFHWDISCPLSHWDISTLQCCNRHLLQMVWQNTKQLGCAVQHCHDMTFVVCHYSNQGNIFDERIYAKGKPCSQCDRDESCNPDEGLCYRVV